MVNKIQQIADHYGIEKQLGMLQEECAELIVATNKYSLSDVLTIKDKRSNLIEEIADVKIMIEQIMYLADITQCDVGEVMKYKINRQIERMGRECL